MMKNRDLQRFIMLWHQNLVIYFVIDSMNNGFGRGCITPSYGNLIRPIDEHGDSQVDFGGYPILQRVTGQTKLVSWTISNMSRYFKQATPHEQSSSFGHGTSIKGAKGNLGWSPNPRILAFFSPNLRTFMTLHASHASQFFPKQNPNLERAAPRQVKNVKKDLQISGINWSLITFTSQLRRKSHYAPRHKPSRV